MIDTVASKSSELKPIAPTLDSRLCRRARLSRDPRFDGVFFIGVKTTGIYCRPICPARPPAEKNVSYHSSAAQAAQAGFRPCLRCRPESAPNSPAWLGTSTSLLRAVRLIEEGALNSGNVPQLADRLGIGERYLRKLFKRELGISPSALALNQRLLFAKKLLAETSLPVTEVAFAAGFGSVRRFNSAVRTQFRLAPGRLRKRSKREKTGTSVKLHLHYRPPYDWQGVINFFLRHAVSGVDEVCDSSYRKNITIGGARGCITVQPLGNKDALLLELDIESYSDLMLIVSRVRRMFDLDANPAAIAAVLNKDQYLKPLIKRYPGIRSPGSWALEESAIRAVVGQQISTKAAQSVLARLTEAASLHAPVHGFPKPEALIPLEDACFPMPARRRDTLRAVCALCASASGQIGIEELAALKGIGPWTTAMVAMRGGGYPDSWPPKDLGLVNAFRNLGAETDLELQSHSWGPWRSYAANLLWRSLAA
jgi:AraC family transcriptional regulator of adaptative response / DNA-3-methyladenine glycosylase II